ncbi:MAG TPA: LysR substrate-binding domain-containing protein [Flavobacterium sp.]|nr:LysR substrate-binding domain-containing protein [Flavobacterium sp.]
MTITQLEYVIAVAKHQNFTLAAEKCHVTQPTLSMQIQKLEDELGVKIFDRSKKSVLLTEVGAEIVNQAKNVLGESERIYDIIDQQKGFVGGTFKLGVIPTITPTLVPMFLTAFNKKYPKVLLSIEEYPTEELIYRLKNRLLDAAIAATPLEEKNIEEKPLYYEPFVGYFPPSFALKESFVTPDDLDVSHLLLLEDGHCFRNGVLNLCKASKLQTENKFEIKTGNFETIIKLANEGLGITLLPYLHTLDLKPADQKNLVSFKDPKPSREVSLIYEKSGLKGHIIEALHETIKSVVRGAIAFYDVEIISPRLNR